MRRAGPILGAAVCLLIVGRASGGASEGLRKAEQLRPLPAGLWLPVALRGGLRAGHTRVGAEVMATVTQRVPVGGGEFLDRQASLVGTVVASQAGGGASELDVRWTAVRYRQQTVPVTVQVLAIASRMAIEDTFAPATNSSDRSNPSPGNWTTRQVGGDEVVRERWEGPVVNTSTRTVGKADYDGVYTLPVVLAGGLNVPLAVGVFSTGARGVYGMGDGVSLRSADGVMRLRDTGGSVRMSAGEELLVEVR